MSDILANFDELAHMDRPARVSPFSTVVRHTYSLVNNSLHDPFKERIVH